MHVHSELFGYIGLLADDLYLTFVLKRHIKTHQNKQAKERKKKEEMKWEWKVSGKKENL